MEACLIKIISFTLLVIETLVGIVANGFIILMNSIDWFRSRKLSAADLILTCLGLSRLVWQTVVFLDETVHFFPLAAENLNYKHLLMRIVWIFMYSMNAWFATLLGVFYFAKITIFSHPIFLQVKQRISGLVPRLLLGSVALSAITSIISITAEPTLSNGLSIYFVSSSFLSINGSEIKVSHSGNLSDIVLTASTSIPLLLCLSSSVLLIISLWKHKRHLQNNGIGIKDLNTQAHLTAIKALMSFSVLYLSSFLAFIAQTILIWNNMDHTWPIMLIANVIAAFPSGHAFILILINPKLKQTWVRMLQHLQCCLHEMSPENLPNDVKERIFSSPRRTL